MVATAAPGISDILVLGKVKQLERTEAADLILLDAPAAGHAISFLRSAHGLLDAVRVGPVNAQAADVLELLTDPTRCRVMLVTLPEETPVNELVETAYSLEDEVGRGPRSRSWSTGCIPSSPGLDRDPRAEADAAGLVVPPAELAAMPRRPPASASRRGPHCRPSRSSGWPSRCPSPSSQLPFLFSTELGPDDLAVLSDSLTDAIRALAPEAAP